MRVAQHADAGRTQPPPPDPGRSVPGHHFRSTVMKHIRAELLRSANRSGVALLAVCLALTLFSMLNAGPQGEPPIWGFRQAAIFVATLAMGRAATTAASDFSLGTIRPWLISASSRGGAFFGKL